MDPLTYNEVCTRPSLEERLESIISGAALMADSSCTRDERRERIVAECNAVRQALQDLLSEYMSNVSIVFLFFIVTIIPCTKWTYISYYCVCISDIYQQSFKYYKYFFMLSRFQQQLQVLRGGIRVNIVIIKVSVSLFTLMSILTLLVCQTVDSEQVCECFC